MILYSLRCADEHRFDAWFRNGAAYDVLAAAGEVVCPVCGGRDVAKAPMAPRIGRGARADITATQETAEPTPPAAIEPAAGETAAGETAAGETAAGETAAGPAVPAEQLRTALAAIRAHVEANCDYVGARFPEEARRIHYNETPARAIYGEAAPAEVEALREEGVALQRIPWLPRTDS